MKKVLVSIFAIALFSTQLNAQAKGSAIGLRTGGFDDWGAEVTFQRAISQNNRLEFNLGSNNIGIVANGMYQWVWDLSSLADGFNWYAGVGAGVASFNDHWDKNYLCLGALGQIGIEYNFDVPIQLSLDYRPGLYIAPKTYNSVDGICFSARYRF